MPLQPAPANQFGPHIVVNDFLKELKRLLGNVQDLKNAKDRGSSGITLSLQQRLPLRLGDVTLELPQHACITLTTKGKGQVEIINIDGAERRRLSAQDILDVSHWCFSLRGATTTFGARASPLPTILYSPIVAGIHADSGLCISYGGAVIFQDAPWFRFVYSPTVSAAGEGYVR